MLSNSRRQFIRTSTFAGLGSVPIIANTKSSAKVIGANDRMRIAVAGLNGRGKVILEAFFLRKMLRFLMLLILINKSLVELLKNLKTKASQ